VRVDVLADRKLVGGDDPLALVADVDEDLVVVDAHDTAGDDLALLEGGEGGVVVRDDLPSISSSRPSLPSTTLASAVGGLRVWVM
jgi:hypothetical protein